MTLLIGVDLGTSETKAGLFDLDGNLLRLARRGYPLLGDSETGAAEQDPALWQWAVYETLREVGADVAGRDLAALCVGGQGPSLVLVDGAGEPLHNAILWMDTRTASARTELAERLGQPVSPFAYLPIVMWLREQRAGAWGRARRCLTAWDFVVRRLCGQEISSVLAAYRPFPAEQVTAAGLASDLFAPEVRAGQAVGGLLPQVAGETGLPAGLPVVSGVHDGLATFIGAGLVDVGRAADVDGTSGGLALCWDEPIERAGIFCEAWIEPGRYIVGGAMAALGRALDWVRDVVASPQTGYEELVEWAMAAPPGADGLLFLPYLAGERAPIWDPRARGVLFGLSLRHHSAHVVRAVLEGVAFAIRHLATELVACGARVDELRVCGGQARSPQWNQIKADVTGFPVAVPRVTEAALMGAAVLAGAGAGLFDISTGAERMVRIVERLDPHPERHGRYDELFGVYERLYPDLRAAFHQLYGVAQRQMGSSLTGKNPGLQGVEKK